MMQTALTAVRTRRGLAAAALVVVGAIVLLAFPYGGTRGVRGIAAARTYELRGAYLTPATSFSADPLLQSGTSPLVAVTPGAHGRLAQARVIVDRRVVVVRRLALPAGAGELRFVRWSGGRVGVALLRRAAGAVDVSVASLDSGRRFADAHIPLATPGATAAHLGPWNGQPNDLFVLSSPRPLRAADRATGAQPQPQLTVVGVAPPFQRPVLAVGLPLAGMRAADWDVLVARLSGALPDLVLIRRRGAKQAEVHVLSGESRFQAFIFHGTLDLPSAVAHRASFVPVLQDGRLELDAIDAGAGRATVRVFPLGATPAA
jgi:hypothetical protein